MKLELDWSDFAQQLDSFIEEGTQLHLTEKEVLTEPDFNDKKGSVEDWITSCVNFLKQSFIEDKFVIAQSFKSAGTNSFQIPGQRKDWTQLKREFFVSLREKINTLIYFRKILGVSDVIVNPESIEIAKRKEYSTQQKLDLILLKLYDLYDMTYYSIPMILEGNGIDLGRNYEDREFGQLLEDAGHINTLNVPDTRAQLTIQGKMYVEEKRKAYYEDYSSIPKNQDEMNSRIDEIIETLKKLGYGQEIIFDDLQELREFYLKLNKKNFGQIVKGKLIDLSLAKLIENDTISYIYEKLTDHTLRLP